MLNFILSALLAFSLSTVELPDIEPADNVSVLMYHEIGEPDGPWSNLYVSEENLIKQLDWILEEGYKTVTMADLEKNRAGKKFLPDKVLVLTFDDGYASMYDFVFPALKERNMKAVFYLYPDKFGGWNSLSPSQIKEMAQAGMEIGSHSKSHSDMTQITKEKLKFELVESKKTLEEITGLSLGSFCYPSGRFNDQVIGELIDAGYTNAVTTQYGKYSLEESVYKIKRVRINYTDSLQSFINKILSRK